MSCIYYSHTGKRAEIHLIHTPAARAVCHHEDDESSEKREVAAQLHKSGHQNKDESTKVTKIQKTPWILTPALRLPFTSACRL